MCLSVCLWSSLSLSLHLSTVCCQHTPLAPAHRIDRLHTRFGFTGVRFKPNLWADAGAAVPYNDDVRAPNPLLLWTRPV